MIRYAKAKLRRPALAAVLAAENHVASRRIERARVTDYASDWLISAFYAKPNGLTRGAQLQIDAMRRSGCSARVADGSATEGRTAPQRPTRVNLVLHSGAPESARLINSLDLPVRSAYPIGYWAWELPDPPQDWKRYERLVSEVWTPSTYSAASLSRLFDVPVHVVPHRVAPQSKRVRDLEGRFTVLTMADSRSSFDRKNPLGAVAAFKAAFGDRPDVRLIVKLLGRPMEVGELVAAVGDASNIEFLTEELDLHALQSLFREADALLSMHRAEGFGLPLLEAMAHGVPAVATGWSGNLDFMSENDSVLVPYELVDVYDDAGVYRYASRWADPDVDAAACALRRLADDHDWYTALSAAAHDRAQQLTKFEVPWFSQ